jgi:dTMP kinase
MSWLIAIEGIDGSGKGTQASRLVESLQQQGLRAASLQFPRYNATLFGRAIGDFLNGRFGDLNQVHPQLAAVLYAGDRFESRELLLSMMRENEIVVLDRFVGSNLAHQAAKLEGEARAQLTEWIEQIEFGVFQLPRPSLTVLIDMSSKWSRELVGRKAAREYTTHEADLQEQDLPYLEKVRRCYQDLAMAREDWSIVRGLNEDGTLRTIDDVGCEILQTVQNHIRT